MNGPYEKPSWLRVGGCARAAPAGIKAPATEAASAKTFMSSSSFDVVLEGGPPRTLARGSVQTLFDGCSAPAIGRFHVIIRAWLRSRRLSRNDWRSASSAH